MRVIKKSEVRKIIIGHVELTLIFLFNYLLCKIAILESLKVLFLDKKQKLLSDDGMLITYSYLEGQNVRNFQYPVRIRWSRQPNLVPFYLYNRIFECPENIRNDGFPDVRWFSTVEFL